MTYDSKFIFPVCVILKVLSSTGVKGAFCDEITKVQHGDVITSSSPPYEPLSTISIKCDSGYKAHGKPIITCLDNGKWSDPVPYCQTTTCVRNEANVEGGGKCRKPCEREADCKGQYKKCRCDGWCGRSCFNPAADCNLLQDLENGYIIGDERSYGHSVTYGCNAGFVLVGRPTRRCQSDRTWSGSAPKCVALSMCGQLQNRDIFSGYVVSGGNAKLGAWPWQVLLFYNSGHKVKQIYDKESGLGGGSLIDNKWILTAGHNIDGFPVTLESNSGWKNYFLLALGLTSYPKVGEEIPEHVHIFEPLKIYRHPKYNKNILDYDVALIRVGQRLKRQGSNFVPDPDAQNGHVTFSRFIRPVCLPCMKSYPLDSSSDWWENFDDKTCLKKSAELIKDGVKVWVTGFGYTNYPRNAGEAIKFKPDTMQEGQLKIWSNERCAAGLQKITPYDPDARYTDRMFCSGSADDLKTVDACTGDSGGAIVKQVETKDDKYWLELGIVSWGWECGTDLPAFYVRLPSVMSWVIRAITQSDLGVCQKKNIAMAGILGGFKYDCNEDGTFKHTQCFDFFNQCWCVDPATGVEKDRTRMRADLFNLHCAPKDCSWKQWEEVKCVRTSNGEYRILEKREKDEASLGGKPCNDLDGTRMIARCDELSFIASNIFDTIQSKGKVQPGGSASDLKKRDVLFLVDASGSVGTVNFKTELALVKAITEKFCGSVAIGQDKTRVAVMTFASIPQARINFNDYFEKDKFLQALDAVSFEYRHAGRACLNQALNEARDTMFTKARGSRIGDDATDGLLILITDGCPNCYTGDMVAELRRQQLLFTSNRISLVTFMISVNPLHVCAKQMQTLHDGSRCYQSYLQKNWHDFENLTSKLSGMKQCIDRWTNHAQCP